MEIIVGKTAGFCYGVERAVNGAKEELNNGGKVYCLGEIVHNQNVVDDLKKQGLEFIENINEAKGKTIIRAHGISREVYKKAEELKIQIKDLTCPSVLKIHDIADEYAKKGYYIILTGKEKHPEVIGIASFCGENYSVIENEEEIEKVVSDIESKNIKNILLISQTTYSLKKFENIQKKLENILGDTCNLEIKQTICPSTRIRQEETEKIAKQVDIMIIIGDKKSSNTNKLYDISCEFCKNVIFINDASELNLENIKKANKIGIMAGASTPKKDIVDVKNKIGEVI